MQPNNFNSYGMKYRPDQHVQGLKEMARTLNSNQQSTRIVSPDGKQVIIIGVQPDKTFGIVLYKILGDRLEQITKVL